MNLFLPIRSSSAPDLNNTKLTHIIAQDFVEGCDQS